jgi:hypothetical protein
MKPRTTKPSFAAFAALVMLLLSFAVLAGGPGKPQGSASPGVSSAKITYVCPIHPDVTSEEPGRCPKCGMYLEAKPQEVAYYTCPMHAGVRQDHPGKCPQCGMALQRGTEKVAYVYTCPMHPEVRQNRAGKCPKCGMFLEARVVAPAPERSAGPAVPAAGTEHSR